MLETRFIASVAERDIDLLLLEEFSVSEKFREWFSNQASGNSEYQSKVGVWHSVVDASLGESDLIFVFTSKSGERVAILIENKIDASPQPDQGGRYKQRGQKGISEGYWERFITCVIAPKRYLQSSMHNQVYDVEIPYENVAVYFSESGQDSERLAYKAAVIQEAIEQNRRGYQPEYSLAMTKFVEDYYERAAREFSELKMQEAKPRPSGSTWVIFNPTVLPRGAYLCHQLAAGMVKLFFGPPSSIESVSDLYRPHISEQMKIEPAGKSVAIIMQSPKIDPLNLSVSQQQEAVRIGLMTASELLEVAKRAAASNNSFKRTGPVEPAA